MAPFPLSRKMGQDTVVPDANTPAFFGYLEEYMDRLFVDHTTRITIDEYMDISSKISEAILANTAILPGSSTTEAASYFEEELFYWLVDYLTDYLEGFLAKADEASGESLLRMYVDEWSYYAGILKVVDRAFRPLNEGWILRAKPTRNVYPIEVTMVQMWYSRLFARIHTRLSDAVIALVDKERSGGVVDSMLIERLYTSFVNLNPEGIPDIHAPYRNNLGAYINYYEQPYIFSAIKRLVENTSPHRIEGITIEYIRQVLQGIEEEELRGRRYLHPDSRVLFKSMLNQFLVNNVAELVRQDSGETLRRRNKHGLMGLFRLHSRVNTSSVASSFESIYNEALEKRNFEELKVIYRFLSRVKDEIGLEPLCEQFQGYVKQYMLDHCPAVPKDVAEGKQLVTPAYTKDFVEWLIVSLAEHEAMIKEPFGNNPKLVAAFNDAFTNIVSSKELHGMTLDTIPRLLADYCDSLLKSNSEFVKQAEKVNADPETALTDKAKQVLRIYEFNRDKDIFAKFYERHLARRLIYEQSFSPELETTVSGMISGITGGDLLTNNTKEMLNDILVSQDLTSEFSHWIKDNNQSSAMQVVATGPKTLIPLNAKVLKAGAWPFSAGVKLSNTGDSKVGTINLPLSLSSMRDSFDNMYTEKHEKRKLHWLWNHSRVELKLFLPHATGAAAKLGYTLILNTYQATILALFTEESGPGEGYDSPQGPTLTCRQIQTATGLDYDTVSAELTVFIKAGIMASNTKTLSERSRICLNPKFQSKRISINLAGIKRSEKKQEITDTVSAAGSHRIALIEAAIIRIMKDRKKLRYPELERLLPGQISRYFPFHICDMKMALDNLIDREYIERNENDEKEFTYTA